MNGFVCIIVYDIVCMGSPVSLYFLTKVVDQIWKDQHIHSYITLAGAWDGANSGIGMIMSGLPIESHIFFPASLYHTFSTLFYLLPRTSIRNNTVLASTLRLETTLQMTTNNSSLMLDIHRDTINSGNGQLRMSPPTVSTG